MPAGRPSLYTPELGEEICSQIAEGKSLRTICKPNNMPDITDVFNWIRDTEDLSERLSYIYVLKDPQTQEVRYVGKTDYPRQREYQHIGKQQGTTHRANWIRSIQRKGLKPKFELIDAVSIDNWKELETYWVKEYLNKGAKLVNHDEGGKGATSGVRLSKIHKLKKDLRDCYRILSRLNPEEAGNLAERMRFLYYKSPDKIPKSWKTIGA